MPKPPRRRSPGSAVESQQIFDFAPEALVVVGEDGLITAVNRKCEAMFGYGRNALLGKEVELLVPEKVRPAHVASRRQYARSPFPRAMGSGVYLEAVRRDGSSFPVDISLSPIRTKAGLRVVAAIRDATERRETEASLAWRATHDPLTGLPNRGLVMDRLGMALARARRRPRSVGVLFVDLDRFKEVNDRYGHDAGDRLLVAIGAKLVRAVREGDTVGRIGGDEFVVLCEELTKTADVVDIARRILAALGSPVPIGETSVGTLASIGIVIARDGEQEPQAVLHLADQAMYRAKARGGSGYHVREDPSIPVRGDRTQAS